MHKVTRSCTYDATSELTKVAHWYFQISDWVEESGKDPILVSRTKIGRTLELGQDWAKSRITLKKTARKDPIGNFKILFQFLSIVTATEMKGWCGFEMVRFGVLWPKDKKPSPKSK